ncbi:amidohydrolase family protein [Bradyrhizobium sp. SSUT112]|nr:amidohydrolase family protein [Bradyrhizobium sp. SSUT112]MDH2351673.1 amidohydrolase family protein [Bradyrhizobium sp. SSUT112]
MQPSHDGSRGHAPTGGGWLSYYVEEHQSNAHTIAAQLASLVIEGVPERFPILKFVFIEGGFGWIPSAVWRMDQHFERFRSEVSHLKRKPSEYVREHFWFTTQPIDEPDEARHLRSLIEWVGVDRLLFSSDYPHWERSYPVAVERGEELRKGPYVAETYPVHVEDSYVIVEV